MSTDSSSRSAVAARSMWQRAVSASLLTVAVIFAFFAIQVIVSIFFGVFAFAIVGRDELEQVFDSPYVLLALTVVNALITAVIFRLLIGGSRKEFLSYIKLSRLPVIRALGTTAVAFVMYAVTFVFIATFVSLLTSVDTNQAQQLGFASPAGLELLAAFIVLVVIAPLLEELVFRGFLYNKVRELVPATVAIPLVSIAFGLGHLELLTANSPNWIAAIDTSVFSVFLIAVYVQTRSLWTPIALHALKNSIAFTLLFVVDIN